MGSFFASFVDWLIGSPGRFVVNLIEDNMLIFMFVVMIYATTILYAKWTLAYYLPKKNESVSRNENVGAGRIICSVANREKSSTVVHSRAKPK